jgi:2-methylcitrate dehydratase PrpD
MNVAYPKGHPENSFSDAEVEEKFLRLAEPSLGRTRCRKFIDWAWRLEQAENIGELFRFWQFLDRFNEPTRRRL